MPVLNANLLDYLYEHPELIPESWKKDASGNTRYMFFWGTVCRSSGGHLYVRCLYWYDGRWDWSIYWLGNVFVGSNPAVVLA